MKIYHKVATALAVTTLMLGTGAKAEVQNRGVALGLGGNYSEPTGGLAKISMEGDSWKFYLLNGSTPGNWPVELIRAGQPPAWDIEFSEGRFKGGRYHLMLDSSKTVKELQQEGGRGTVWTRQR